MKAMILGIGVAIVISVGVGVALKSAQVATAEKNSILETVRLGDGGYGAD